MSAQDSTPIPDGYKRCPDCGEVFPRTADYFHRARNRPDGLYNYCKKCATARTRQWELEHPEEVAAKHRTYSREHREERRPYQREWARAHSEQHKQYYRDHKEEFRERRKQQYQHEKEQAKQRARDWYRVNKTRVYASARIGAHRRMARKRSLPVDFTNLDWKRALEYFHERCAVCGRPQGLRHTLAMDHWIPLSSPDCPGTIPSNIIPLCHGMEGCNNSKGNRSPEIWLMERLGVRKAKQILKRIRAYQDWLDELE